MIDVYFREVFDFDKLVSLFNCKCVYCGVELEWKILM